MWSKYFFLHGTYLKKIMEILTYIFDWLFFTQFLTSFSSIENLLESLCMVFDFISSNIYEVLSINPSANVFVFGDFNVHHKGWLTYFGGTDRSGDLKWPYSDVNFILTFPPLRNSDHVVVSVFIDFPSNSHQDASFQHITYDYSHADWDGLCGYLRDVPWVDIFRLSAFAAACEFC